MDNDTALDWMGSRVEEPLASAIRGALRGYLDGLAHPSEAEAAAALLIDYSSRSGEARYRPIDLSIEAEKQGLWRLGCEAVRKMSADGKWIGAWLDPQTKLRVLDVLLAELQDLEAAETKG